MRLSESMYCVGCGYVGFNITHANDCNVYILRGPDGLVMIDAGGGEEPEQIEQQMKWDGLRVEDIKAIIITHPHVDHAGGAAYWKKRTGAKIIASELAAPYMRKGGEYHPGKPGESIIPPCPVDLEIKPNASFDAAGLRFESMPAPGHCASMLFFFTKLDGRKVLITGDAFCWGGKVTVFYFPDADRKIFRETLSRLKAERDFDAFLPGHRYPVMRGGKEHLDMAIQEINRQLAGQPAMKG